MSYRTPLVKIASVSGTGTIVTPLAFGTGSSTLDHWNWSSCITPLTGGIPWCSTTLSSKQRMTSSTCEFEVTMDAVSTSCTFVTPLTP